jgi:cytochrome c peroxidase
VLFYDTRLSANDTIACASCHLQAVGFSDQARLSVGFEGGTTRRNSMGLTNARFFQGDLFFWDTRAASLEALVLEPIQDPIEMGSSLPALIAELEAESFYPPLFEAAFGSANITEERIAKAVAQFIRSLVSAESKFDQGYAVNFINFTPQERQGMDLFQSRRLGCNICHITDTQILNEALNNGLDRIYLDNGVGEITGNRGDDGKFKPPSLRNVAVTAPYMHDGRIDTLEAVIEHYSSGVKAHPNRSPFVPIGGFRLNAQEKAALVAFLKTLTDEQFLRDVRFSDPFLQEAAVGLHSADTPSPSSPLPATLILIAITLPAILYVRRNPTRRSQQQKTNA